MMVATRGVDRRYPAQPDSVPSARRELARFAREAGAHPAQVDAVRLAVSEAVTNAVLHAYPDGIGDVQVTGIVSGDALRIVVRDSGCGMRHRAARPGLGLGLGLIAEITDEMAVVPRARGTELQMRFSLEPASSHAYA